MLKRNTKCPRYFLSHCEQVRVQWKQLLLQVFMLFLTSKVLTSIGDKISTVCPLSVNTSHCTVCWFCVTMSIAVFYSLSTVCQYLTLYRLFVLSHCDHCCLLEYFHCLSVPHTVQSVHCLSVLHTVPSVCSVSRCPPLSSRVCPLSVSTSHCTVCPLSVSTSHCTVCLFCLTLSTALF